MATANPSLLHTGDSAELERVFFSRVMPVPFSGCWIWMGGIRSHHGYGCFNFNRRRCSAHRWSYSHFIGPISDDLQVDHKCRVRLCVNPDHLRLVSGRENTLLGESLAAKNAGKTHCVRGHEFTEENTIRRKFGWRQCRACRTIDNRKSEARRRAERAARRR